MSLSRREIREKAVQALYALASNEELSQEAAMIYVLQPQDVELTDDEHEHIDIPVYLQLLVEGVQVKQALLDKEIEAHLDNWHIDRLAKIDLVIMRTAIFEMQEIEDVPPRVALNEALEIAKKFSDDKSRKFINGVLGKMVTAKEEGK